MGNDNKKKNHKTSSNCGAHVISVMTPSEIALLAVTIAVALTEGKPECEIRAILNLLNMTQDIIIGMLAQKNICDETIGEFIF